MYSTASQMFRRGRSEEPELSSGRVPIRIQQIDNDDQLNWQRSQPRARSVGPALNKRHNTLGSTTRPPPKYGELQKHTNTTNDNFQASRANVHHNPGAYQDFPSLR